jgi:hypothetical protein
LTHHPCICDIIILLQPVEQNYIQNITMKSKSSPDTAIAALLNVPISTLTVSSGNGGGDSSATNFKLMSTSDHGETEYFVKCAKGAKGKLMIEGRYSTFCG